MILADKDLRVRTFLKLKRKELNASLRTNKVIRGIFTDTFGDFIILDFNSISDYLKNNDDPEYVDEEDNAVEEEE